MRLSVQKKVLVSFSLVLSLFLAVFSGLKSYELWPQVTFIWDYRSNPVIEFQNGNPHALRYAVVYPIFVFSEYFSLNYDAVFSVAVVAFLFWTYSNVLKTLRSLGSDAEQSLLWTALIGFVLFTLFCLMNGRASFAFLGYSLLICAISRFHFDEKVYYLFPLTVLLAVTLCGVTSGTLFSALGAFGVFLFFEVRRIFRAGRINARFFLAAAAALAILYSLSDVVLILFEKNMAFFGGGADAFLGMLRHGAGSIIEPVFETIDPALFAIFAAAMLVAFYSIIIRSRHRFILGITALSISLGAFGFTTLSLAAIPATIAMVIHLRGRFKLSYQ